MDVAFVAKELPPSAGGGCKVSARANARTNLDMAKLMGKLGVLLNGTGGGHSKAAGATCKATPEDAVRKCVELAIKELER
jgi:nanoRNase/pAp phosphatase (c-di-AMP/oligoRNAs hydrolase)